MYNFSKIDIAGATQVYVFGLSDDGDIYGTYSDATGDHGFVDRGGTITTIDGGVSASATVIKGIDAADRAFGTYTDAFGQHGFVTSGGIGLTVDATATATATVVLGTTATGGVFGEYSDAIGSHGFVNELGTTRTINATASATGTYVTGATTLGQIFGYYFDSAGTHGFIDQGGTITTVDAVPGAHATFFQGSTGATIYGQYTDDTGAHGLLYAGGTLLTVDGSATAYATTIQGVAADGRVFGQYYDVTGQHGFVSDHGAITTIDGSPDALATFIQGIGPNGEIFGVFEDATGPHGFVDANGQFTLLDLPGADTILPIGITPFLQVVGNASSPDVPFAFISYADLVPPTVTSIELDHAGSGLLASANAATGLAITVTFSEPVVGFDGTDVLLNGLPIPTGLHLTAPMSTDGGKTWSATLTADAGIELAGTISVGTGHVWTDLAGNPGLPGGSAALRVDTTADRNGDLAVSFNAANSAIGAADINAAHLSAAGFTVSGLDADASAVVTFRDTAGHTVTATVTGNTTTGAVNLSGLLDGTVTASIVATDTAGNTATGAPASALLDSKAPNTPTINDRSLDDDDGDDDDDDGHDDDHGGGHGWGHNSGHGGQGNGQGGYSDTANHQLTGTAESGAKVTILDGGSVVGMTTADAAGKWSFQLRNLAEGSHAVSASATDLAGNTGPSSKTLSFIVDTRAPLPAVTDVVYNKVTKLTTYTGTSEAGSQVTVYDGKSVLGTAIADASGQFSFTSRGSDTKVHTLTAVATDKAGNTGFSAGATLFAEVNGKALTGTTGDDWIIGHSGDTLTGAGGVDHFVFNAGFGKNTVTDFRASTTTVKGDVLVFDHALFGSFASVMSHAQQVGGDVLISFDAANSVLLRGVTLGSLHAGDFLFI